MMLMGMFKHADSNKDGKISLEEVPSERKESFKKLLEKADKDGDKAVSVDEARRAAGVVAMRFRAARGGHGPPFGPHGRPEVAGPEARRAAVMGRFKASDTNKDGKLSKDEAPEPLKAHFDRIDADKDGQLTPAELTRAGAAARKQTPPRRTKGESAEKPVKPREPEKKGEKKEEAKKGESE
jgi:Ca2+-binding EF-hand superfamily protein